MRFVGYETGERKVELAPRITAAAKGSAAIWTDWLAANATGKTKTAAELFEIRLPELKNLKQPMVF